MTNNHSDACDTRINAARSETSAANDRIAISSGGDPHSGEDTDLGEQAAQNDPWVYMAEIAHRTINEYTIAISMISRIASDAPDYRTQSMLRRVEFRLRNAARTQQLLASPPRTGTIDLATYLQPLCSAISSFALEENGIFLTLSCENISLKSARCWRVGLIIFELIMNARRHAFPNQGGLVRVEVNYEGSQVHCRVVDNGIGTRAFAPGRGSDLVESLAADLGGTIERPHSDSGTNIRLLFSAD